MENENIDINTSDVDLKPKEKEEVIEIPAVSDDPEVECIIDANETVVDESKKECAKTEDSEESIVTEDALIENSEIQNTEITIETAFAGQDEDENQEKVDGETEDKTEDKADIDPEEELNKVKKQRIYQTFMKDIIEYDKLKEEYKEWILKSKLLGIETRKCSEKVCDEINKFLEIAKGLQEGKLDEKIESFLEGRIKGIKLIEKMINNVVKNNLSDFEQLSEEEIAILSSWESVKEMDVNVILKTENQNYNIITSLKAKKDSLIRNYFKFITSDILNILDGVRSGIQFLKQKKEVGQVLNPVEDIYRSLERNFMEYFCSINIQKIKVCLGDRFDINLHEAFDLEETDKVELNEKIFEEIRDGFIYSEPLFDMDSNYVIRSAQVIVYKKK